MKLFIAAAALVAIPLSGFAQTPTTTMRSNPKLEVQLPKDATVTLEVDARDDDLLAVLKQFLSFGTSEVKTTVRPAAKTATTTTTKVDAKISVPTPAGTIELEGLSTLFRYIHHVHIVSYNCEDDMMDALAFQENDLKAQGLTRMVYASPESPFLVMRSAGNGPMAIVTVNEESVTVIRTDGLLDMKFIGSLGGEIATTMAKSALKNDKGTASTTVSSQGVKLTATKTVNSTTKKTTSKAPAKTTTSKAPAKKGSGN